MRSARLWARAVTGRRWAAAVAGGAVVGVEAAGVASSAPGAKTQNEVPFAKHKVVLGAWPIWGGRANNDPRTASLAALVRHCKDAGYDGAELSIGDIQATFYNSSVPISQVVAEAKAVAPRGFFTGGTYHIVDGNGSPYEGLANTDETRPILDWNKPGYWQDLRAALSADVEIGAHYASFQIFLPPQYMNTGGEYRNDDAYLTLCARRIEQLQSLCFELGLNFYVETHIDRLSEDLEAFGKIMEKCNAYFELNADLSHYFYRGITQGTLLDKIWPRVGHMHARLARQHGDLSADVPDPVADWEAKGVTYQAFEYYKPALEGGLSSRVIMGESGPMHEVKDSVGLDAKLVPLWRAMAAYADAHSGAGAGPGPAFRGGASGGAGSNTTSSSSFSPEEAERVLAAHFAATGPAFRGGDSGSAGGAGSTSSTYSPEEAERVLAAHFAATGGSGSSSSSSSGSAGSSSSSSSSSSSYSSEEAERVLAAHFAAIDRR
eukprot:COSAG06_NODE_4101_length_4573_cov_2.309119_1_plen_491_part_00